MKKIRIIALLATLIMAGMIVYSLLNGDIAEEGSILLSMAWGQMSMVDLYVGFGLFYLWIWYREENPVVKGIWLPVLIVTGNLGVALFILIKAYQSPDIKTLLIGNKTA